MLSTANLEQAGVTLASWQRTMLLSHERPDGDAFGALAGMQRIIEAGGRCARAFVYAPPPARYAFLAGALSEWVNADAQVLDSQFDGVLIMDTCSWSQLEPVASFLRASRLPRMVIDHHATRDQLADIYVIDDSASAACTLLHRLATVMSWPMPPVAAEALFGGIATDTGWFRFSNADPQSLRAAAALVEAGVRPDVMYARLLETYSPARLGLMAAMLGTLELHADRRIAVMYVTPEMLTASGAAPSDTEDLVNLPLTTAGVVAVALLTETADGQIRANLRSKSPEIVGCDLDVAAVAQQFGGGGHRRAAGARINGPLTDARQAVLTALLAALTP